MNGRRQSGPLKPRREVIFVHFGRFNAWRRRFSEVHRAATLRSVFASVKSVAQVDFFTNLFDSCSESFLAEETDRCSCSSSATTRDAVASNVRGTVFRRRPV